MIGVNSNMDAVSSFFVVPERIANGRCFSLAGFAPQEKDENEVSVG